MSKKKKLKHYLSKIKRLKPITIPAPNSFLLGGCRRPGRTLSFAASADIARDAATLSDVDRFLHENFKTLFPANDYESERRRNQPVLLGESSRWQLRGEKLANNSIEEFGFRRLKLINSSLESLADLPLHGSSRFFVTPGLSGSLVEEEAARLSCGGDGGGSTTSSTSTTESSRASAASSSEDRRNSVTADECIAVFTYSGDPYEDFRGSMGEMVEARLRKEKRVDWEFMEELLFRYFNLNDKRSYKYILSAFVDLVVFLRSEEKKKNAE